MNTVTKIELLTEQTFTARAGDKLVRGLCVESEWEGLRKLTDQHGRHLIIGEDGQVFTGTAGLLHDLSLTTGADEFVQVPATTLPGGQVVPGFQVGKYACSKGEDGRAQVRADAKPWVSINFADAKKAGAVAGFMLITELQWLAIAHQIWHQDINWTGGKVGQGQLYRGLHKGTVNCAQDGLYESPHADERRWHQLANGERIFDIAGNVWQWVFDNVQGNEDGLIARSIGRDSPSRSVAPKDCQKLGGGWQPDGECTWSGNALVRSSCWCSDDDAGVFSLADVWPGYGYGYRGFRCTK